VIETKKKELTCGCCEKSSLSRKTITKGAANFCVQALKDGKEGKNIVEDRSTGPFWSSSIEKKPPPQKRDAGYRLPKKRTATTGGD